MSATGTQSVSILDELSRRGLIAQSTELDALIGEAARDLARLDESTLAAALRETSVAEFKPGTPDGIVDLLVASGLSQSKGAARRTIAEGRSVNNTKIDDEDWVPRPSDFLHGRWLVLRRGKRNIAGVKRVG